MYYQNISNKVVASSSFGLKGWWDKSKFSKVESWLGWVKQEKDAILKHFDINLIIQMQQQSFLWITILSFYIRVHLYLIFKIVLLILLNILFSIWHLKFQYLWFIKLIQVEVLDLVWWPFVTLSIYVIFICMYQIHSK